MTQRTDDLPVMPAAPRSVWLATLTLSLFGLALPLVMLQIFDRIIPFQAKETLLVLLLGLLVVVPLEMIQKVLRAALMNAHAIQHSERLAKAITRRVLNSKSDKNIDALKYYHYLGSSAKIRDGLSGTGRLFLIELPFSFIGLGLIWVLAGPLVLVPLSGFSLLFTAASIVRRIHRKKLIVREEADAQRFYLFGQLIAHADSVKATQFESGLINRYRKVQSKAANASRTVYFSSNLFQSLAQSINLFFSAAIVCAGAYLVIQQRIGAAELAACTMLNGRAAQPLMNAVQQWTSGESFTKTRHTAAEALALPQTPDTELRCSKLDQLGPSIEFRDVTLRASQTGRAILRNFNMSCDKGFVTLSAGATGHVSPVFRSLLGEVEPSRGELWINGQQPSALARFRGNGGIIYINDKPSMFEGSLIFNIAMTDAADVVDRAHEVSSLMGLEADVNKLPNGYSSDMRDSGILLASRGFLQRINIARALTHQPSILLIDDAISAMDRATQLKIAAAIQHFAKSALVLAYDSTHVLERFSDRTICIAAPSRKAGTRRPQGPLTQLPDNIQTQSDAA